MLWFIFYFEINPITSYWEPVQVFKLDIISLEILENLLYIEDLFDINIFRTKDETQPVLSVMIWPRYCSPP